MCGLYGIARVVPGYRRFEDFLPYFQDLSTLNESRGGQAYGTGVLTTKDNLFYKGRGENGSHTVDSAHFSFSPCPPFALLGHTRIATSGTDDELCFHPILTRDFALAHNGILLNYKEVAKQHDISLKIPVDTYVMLKLIELFHAEGLDVPSAIAKTCDLIEGGFACWLVARRTSDIFLFRNMSPLFMSFHPTPDYLSFSSTTFTRSIALKEGQVFQVSPSSHGVVSTFTPKRHY